MNKIIIGILGMMLWWKVSDAQERFTLVVHGGAGTIKKQHMSDAQEAAYRKTLEEALQTGYAILSSGGTSIDAVEQVVRVLENSPLFNAGRGSVYNTEGMQEMDASIMDGNTGNAGAVAGVSRLKNPISAARLVMDSSRHVMLTGKGAELYATNNGQETADADYFYNERRWKQFQRAKQREAVELDHSDQGYWYDQGLTLEEHEKYGTVGAVALDQHGNLAAATSTGGLTNKKYGRVGDSPLIGAGTWADNTCAISCTGHGEYFMRNVVAYDIAAQMQYKNKSLKKAAHKVVNEKLKSQKGRGGIIGVDRKGNVVMTFNTKGMYRGYINNDGHSHVFIYKEE